MPTNCLININPGAIPPSLTTTVTIYGVNTAWTTGSPPTLIPTGAGITSLGAVTVISTTQLTVPVTASATTSTCSITSSDTGSPSCVLIVGFVFNKPTFQTSNAAYFGFATQSLFDTAISESAGTPTVAYLRMDKAASSARWVRGLTMIRTGQGDTVGDANMEAVNPRGTIVLDLPFTPSTHIALLGMCGVVPGLNGAYFGIAQPNLMTFFYGMGFSTDTYYNAEFTGGTITCSRTAPSGRMRLNFTAGQLIEGGTYNPLGTSAGFPALLLPYEKPFHFSNITATSLIGGTLMNVGGSPTSQALANQFGPAKLESITVNITPTNTPLFLARPDGKDLISDWRFDDSTGGIQFTRSFNSDAERKAYLAACDGVIGQMFVTFQAGANCTATAVQTTFSVGCYGQYTVDDITSPDKAAMMESLTVTGTRMPNGYTNAWTGGSLYVPLAFSYSPALPTPPS